MTIGDLTFGHDRFGRGQQRSPLSRERNRAIPFASAFLLLYRAAIASPRSISSSRSLSAIRW